MLGDSPLVLLTALTSWSPTAYPVFKYEGTPSSEFDTVTAPHLNDDGTYKARTDGRKIRVYRTIDTRTMFDDFFARLRLKS